MSDLYPLLLKPEFRERIWGTRDLTPIYGEAPGTAPIGEVWLTGDDCKVANGPLAGASLGELCKKYRRELVGETAREADRFPLLIKFLFPREKLSVQVHPDDDGAKRVGQPCGKTECWYVLKAEPGAQVGLGLKPGTTREQFARSIQEVRAEQLLNWIDIHPGELIYVDAGTVHAIGPGSILVETQQNSDTTYRLYDYGRPRELHVEQGLQALKEKTRAGKVKAESAKGTWTSLVESPSFRVQQLVLSHRRSLRKGAADDPGGSSAEVLVGLDGCATVQCGAESVVLGRGDVVVMPAQVKEYEVRGQWNIELLRARLPGASAPEPVTYL
ncbi:MAG: type I phosphomannose isomerase catalytic subunit [Terriglobales bacterium]